MTKLIYADIQADIAEDEAYYNDRSNDLTAKPIQAAKDIYNRSQELMITIHDTLDSDDKNILSMDVLIGTAYELLLKSILLRKGENIIESHSQIIKELQFNIPFSSLNFHIKIKKNKRNNNNIKTITFRECQKKLKKHLSNFNPKQKKRILDVIDLVFSRRNHYLHLCYAYKLNYRYDYQIFSVYEILLREFIPDYYPDFKQSDYLNIYKVKKGIDYEEVFNND